MIEQPWPWGDPQGDQRGQTIDGYNDAELTAAARCDDEPARTSARVRLTREWLQRNTRPRHGSGE